MALVGLDVGLGSGLFSLDFELDGLDSILDSGHVGLYLGCVGFAVGLVGLDLGHDLALVGLDVGLDSGLVGIDLGLVLDLGVDCIINSDIGKVVLDAVG